MWTSFGYSLATVPLVEGTRPLTAARYPDVESRARDALAALVSSLRDAAGEILAGTALSGALGHGEAASVPGVPVELVAVLDVPLRDAPALERKIRRAVTATARSRKTSVRVRALAKAALPFLPPTVENGELVGAAHVVDGPDELLLPARLSGAPPPEEGLRVLVRAGASLVDSERALGRDANAEGSSRALLLAEEADLSLGAVILLSEGRWVAGDKAREEALRHLSSEPGACTGFRSRLTWTRFRDLVESHRRALLSRAAPEPVPDAGEARKRVALTVDRFLEVLRLFEEDRLGEPLPNWDAYTRILAAHRRNGRTAGLFESFEPFASEEERPLPTRREARAWPAVDRLSPAVAALLDWDPGDLPIVPLLLDLPDDAPREALKTRLLALADDV